MIDVTSIHKDDDYVFMNTGSPHHVQIVPDLVNFNVKEKGASLRYGSLYGNEGSNINFVTKINENKFALRTYERGVEDETLACGTGATATAIAMNATGQTNANLIAIEVQGGKLEVSFDENEGNYTNVFLTGPAEFVFKGSIDV
jgi:diaminopimelate epimerase